MSVFALLEQVPANPFGIEEGRGRRRQRSRGRHLFGADARHPDLLAYTLGMCCGVRIPMVRQEVDQLLLRGFVFFDPLGRAVALPHAQVHHIHERMRKHQKHEGCAGEAEASVWTRSNRARLSELRTARYARDVPDKVDIYGGRRPTQLPLYSVAEAARIVRLRPATLRSWTRGRPYETRGGRRRWPPLVTAADRRTGRLSFANLVELHVLTVLRGRSIRVNQIRSATRFIREQMGTEHPLADVDVHTDQVDLYVEFFGRLVNASRSQAAMRPIVERYLTRIERDEQGLACRLFPATRDGDDLGPRVVIVDPARRFGRPLIAQTGIETSVVAERFHAGESWSDIASDLDLDLEKVEEAVRFEARYRSAA